MDDWVIWLIVAVVFGIGEIATLGFFLAPFAGGALVAAVVAGAGAPTAVSWVAFLVVSVVLLAALRPVALRHRRQAPPLRTGTAALVGQTATVVERVASDEGCRASSTARSGRRARTTRTRCSRRASACRCSRSGAPRRSSRNEEDQMDAGLIALIVVAVFLFIVAATGDPDRAAGAGRASWSGSGATRARSTPGWR